MEASMSGQPAVWEEQWRREKERREQVLGEGKEGIEQDERELRRIVAFNDSRLGLTSRRLEPVESDKGDNLQVYCRQNFPYEVFEVLREFRESCLLTDLIMTTDDGSSFQVHSLILAAVSAIIKKRLREQTCDQYQVGPNQWSFSLGPEVNQAGLQAVVDFAYTGKLLAVYTVTQIKVTARALGVPRMLQFCDKTLGADDGSKNDSANEEMKCTLQSVEQLWADGVGCDVILDVNGALFHAHRVILATSSGYFQGMFTSGMKESRQSRVVLPLKVAPEFGALISSCYRGMLPLSWDCIFETACTAHQFQFKSAESLCLLFMRQEMGADTCLDVASFAEAYGMSELLEEANDYVLRNFLEVSAHAKFLDLQAEKLLDFLCSDGLSVPSELVVFRAVVSWVEADPEERWGRAGKLMKGVRFSLMTFREFKEVRAINLRMEAKEMQLYSAAFKEFGSTLSSQDQWRVRRPKASLVLVGGDQLNPDVGPRIPSREVWFANSLRSGTGLVKDIEWRRLGEVPSKPMFRHAVATIRGRLFVVGGCHFYCENDVMKSTYSYDPVHDVWKRCADMQEFRSNFSLVVFQGRLYAVGGDKEMHNNLDSVEMYDPKADSWSFVHPLDQPLSGQAATIFNGKIFIAGGFDHQYVCLTSLLLYHPEAGSTHLADMTQNRAQHCMEALRGCLYVAGGLCNLRRFYTDQLACELYDPTTDSWTSFASLPMPHVGAASAFLEENLYILGGYCQEDHSESGLVHRYNRSTQRWEIMGKLPAAVTDIRACVLQLPQHLRC
ncbi:kelch-like protein 33 isoform X1 [Nerophis ophidion]|uniref:kelch-like protein 33 isoform X1 n=1 Tax=Nerophis ophidion TaxID=159077 RepID=UPI002ADF5827|nr:kelch-like protein 33 isoform X1 [Nerophis ophidion]